MSEYNLAPGEFLIMQEKSVRLGTLSDNEDLTELVLTNHNIILVNDVDCGLFRTERYLKRCPLSDLQRHQGVAQTPVVKQKDRYCLQMLFPDETISVLFLDGARRTAERWSNAIQQAAAGDFNNIDASDVLPPELAEFIDGTKDFFGSFGGKKHNKKRTGSSTSEAVGASTSLSARCPGCHAPLTGYKGEIVTCSYCDTKHAL